MIPQTRTAAVADSSSSGSAYGFSERGYGLLRKLVTGPALAFLYEYASKTARFGITYLDDPNAPGAPSWTNDAMMEALLEALLPALENATQRKLLPTYACLRMYRRGDILRRHVDRPSCEISMTLCLGFAGSENWPIWLESAGVPQSFALEPGDGLVYKGVELPHWRDPCTLETAVQVFLHYVNRDGPFKDWRFDKRASLASTPVTREIINGFGDFLR